MLLIQQQQAKQLLKSMQHWLKDNSNELTKIYHNIFSQ